MAFTQFSKFQIAAAKRAALSIKQLTRQKESANAKVAAYVERINATKEKIADLQTRLEDMQTQAEMMASGYEQFQSQIDAFNAPFVNAYGMTAEEVANSTADTPVETPAEQPVEEVPAPEADDEPEPSINDAYDAEGNYIGNWPNDVVGYAGQNNQ